MQQFQSKTVRADIHRATRSSLLDSDREGIPVDEIVERAQPKARATDVLVHAANGYTTNLAIADFMREPAGGSAQWTTHQPATRRAAAPLRAASLLLEERQMGDRVRVPQPRPSGILGELRVLQSWRPWREERYGHARLWACKCKRREPNPPRHVVGLGLRTRCDDL
jgi:hypothetical protein